LIVRHNGTVSAIGAPSCRKAFNALKSDQPRLRLAKQVAGLFAPLPEVEAVALSGSCASKTGASDSASDIDLYVFTRGDIPLESRESIVYRAGGATQSSLDLNYWGMSDEWIHIPSGLEIDVVYFDAGWMENEISRVVEKHQASLGYTTCFWHTIRHSIPFSDPHAWFSKLQQRCLIEYPESLRQNIIAMNHPVLRTIIPAYATQIEKAVAREDLVSINHRLAAFFASYFDIIFAVNRQLHPGEKRLVSLAISNCKSLPANMETDIHSILLTAGAHICELPGRLARFLDCLDTMLEAEGLLRKRPL
jgi:Domain of unknown function (DUF4037)